MIEIPSNVVKTLDGKRGLKKYDLFVWELDDERGYGIALEDDPKTNSITFADCHYFLIESNSDWIGPDSCSSSYYEAVMRLHIVSRVER